MAVSQNLTLTESKVDNASNTSEVTIKWTSTQSGDSWNGYTRTAYYYVSINGEAETKHSVSYILPQSTTATIVNTTITVPHKNNGTATIAVRTWMDTSISAGVVELNKSLTLTTIPRASTIKSTNMPYFGERCVVNWIPCSASFRYKIKFSLGTWSETTGIIHPNRETEYSYRDYIIPLNAISQLSPFANYGYITVTLYTYSDSNATVLLGSDVYPHMYTTVRKGSATDPKITMTLAPVTQGGGVQGAYLQGLSRVQATFSGSATFGATIKSYSLKVEGQNEEYSEPYLSDVLVTPGLVEVKGTVTDSRNYSKTSTQYIRVVTYSKPSVTPHSDANSIVCRRCLSDGTLDNGGTYLLIKIGRKYNKVVVDGTQKNFCTLSYRYKTDAQDIDEYSNPQLLLDKTASTDYVSAIIPNVVTSNTTAYNIQLIAEDDVGYNDVVTITIPTMFVTLHIPEGGHGLTIGGYHDPNKHDTFDCKFNAEFHGTVSGSVYGLLGSSGEIPAYGDLNDYRTPGVYAVTNSSTAGTIKNMPNLINPTDGKIYHLAGLLRVFASIGQTYVTEGAWKYVTQEYRALTAEIPDYRRVLSSDGDGTWHSGEWVSALGT